MLPVLLMLLLLLLLLSLLLFVVVVLVVAVLGTVRRLAHDNDGGDDDNDGDIDDKQEPQQPQVSRITNRTAITTMTKRETTSTITTHNNQHTSPSKAPASSKGVSQTSQPVAETTRAGRTPHCSTQGGTERSLARWAQDRTVSCPVGAGPALLNSRRDRKSALPGLEQRELLLQVGAEDGALHTRLEVLRRHDPLGAVGDHRDGASELGAPPTEVRARREVVLYALPGFPFYRRDACAMAVLIQLSHRRLPSRKQSGSLASLDQPSLIEKHLQGRRLRLL